MHKAVWSVLGIRLFMAAFVDGQSSSGPSTTPSPSNTSQLFCPGYVIQPSPDPKLPPVFTFRCDGGGLLCPPNYACCDDPAGGSCVAYGCVPDATVNHTDRDLAAQAVSDKALTVAKDLATFCTILFYGFQAVDARFGPCATPGTPSSRILSFCDYLTSFPPQSGPVSTPLPTLPQVPAPAPLKPGIPPSGGVAPSGSSSGRESCSGTVASQPASISSRPVSNAASQAPGSSNSPSSTITKVTAVFCVGLDYRDGIDGSFCSDPYEPATNVTLFLTIGAYNLPPMVGRGPWNETTDPIHTLTSEALTIPAAADATLRAALRVSAAGNDEIKYNLNIRLTFADGRTSPPFCWLRQSCGASGTSCVNCICTLTDSDCYLPGAYNVYSTPCQSCESCGGGSS